MSDSTCEQVFISYAHADVQWRDEFERMLAPARARGLIDVWSDEAIVAGENWFQNIQRALTRARVGLLLVSDHFLQSEFVKREEFAQLIEAAKAGRVSVRWVPVSACLYECTELKDIQACCDPKRPLDKLPEADRKAAIQKICLEIIQDFGVKQPTVSPSRRETLFNQVQECLRGKYILKEEIAAGKFSVIYRAEREHPRRVVAVKTIVASELDDCTRRAFIESVERAFELTSSAFIKILDHFLDGSPEVLVSEFVSGEQLTRLLQHHPEGLPLPAVKSILLDLAKGIEEAHVRGWRRGEMCPSDILVEQSGLARISPTDFGNLLREEALLHGNYVVDHESLAYMTPERYFGREPSLLTDQYSLGLIAVELLGGPCMPKVVRPCDLEGKRELFIELQEGRGKWAKRSRDFAGVVCRMLRIDPQERWASMAVARELLHEIEVSESPEERARKIAISSYVRVQARGVAGEREALQPLLPQPVCSRAAVPALLQGDRHGASILDAQPCDPRAARVRPAVRCVSGEDEGDRRASRTLQPQAPTLRNVLAGASGYREAVRRAAPGLPGRVAHDACTLRGLHLSGREKIASAGPDLEAGHCTRSSSIGRQAVGAQAT